MIEDRDELLIALTFDTDNDYFDQSLVGDGEQQRNLMTWRGVEEGIPLIREVLHEYTDDFSLPARPTWFVRVDTQIETLYGNANYLLERYEALWNDFHSRGDEIGWHPHLYRIMENTWVQETDEVKLARDLTHCWKIFKTTGFTPSSSRIGEAFCSNVILSTLEKLGILCDSTAMPGRKRIDAERSIDWEGTQRIPYFPSRGNYRIPGQDSLTILEIPMSMIKTMSEYDSETLLRYVDLSFYHKAMKKGLTEYLKEASILVTVTHPCAILNGIINRRHGLISFDITELRKNLEHIISECHRFGRKYRFVTMRQCRDYFVNG